MEIFAGRSVKISAAAIVLLACSTVSFHAFSASKVQTQRIFVPEEKEGISDPSPETEEKPSLQIPRDALPDLQGKSENDNSVNDDDRDGDHNIDPGAEEEDEGEGGDDSGGIGPAPKADRPVISGPPPPVQRDISKLPKPVQRTRNLLLETAKKGDIEGLRNLIGLGESATSLSLDGLEGDPIEHLKDASGDDAGFEILAILIEVLEAGYVHLNAGTPEEVYVWPYFYAWPFDKLTPEMNVELYRILTAGDVEDSKSSGRYIFFRVGIKPDGDWAFFVAGD